VPSAGKPRTVTALIQGRRHTATWRGSASPADRPKEREQADTRPRQRVFRGEGWSASAAQLDTESGHDAGDREQSDQASSYGCGLRRNQIGYGGTRGRRVGRWRLYLRRVRTGPERSWLQAEILSLRREVECRPGSPSDGAKHLDQLAASHHKKPISSDLARDREAVKEAARLYNEGITNGFLRLSLFRRHQHQLLLNGTLALLATLVVLTIAAGDLEACQWPSGSPRWWPGKVPALA
jgi:hypothetical protein